MRIAHERARSASVAGIASFARLRRRHAGRQDARSASSSTPRSPTARATASAPRSSTPSSFRSRASTTRRLNLKAQPGAAHPRCASSTCSEPCDASDPLPRSSLRRLRLVRRLRRRTRPPAESTGRTTAGTRAPLSCVPNLDGQIDATELKAALGVPVNYLVSPPGMTRAGEPRRRGGRRRATSSGTSRTDYADDQVATIAGRRRSQGKWYAASFPTGSSSRPFDAGDTLEGSTRTDDQAASTCSASRRRSRRRPRADALRLRRARRALPLPARARRERGRRRATCANGMLRGLPYAGTDTYDGHASTRPGELVLPDYTFTQAHRVRDHGDGRARRRAQTRGRRGRSRSSSSASARWRARPASRARRTTISPRRPRCAASVAMRRRRCWAGTCGRRASTRGRTRPRSTSRRDQEPARARAGGRDAHRRDEGEGGRRQGRGAAAGG